MQTAPFAELITVTTVQAVNHNFDIIIDTEVTLQNYCQALIIMIFSLPRCQLYSFICYQTNLVKDASLWLTAFENFIDYNEDLFASKKASIRFNKLYSVIDKIRTELQSPNLKEVVLKTPKRLINAENEERYFSFYEVKMHIESLTNYSDKILFLNNEIGEYKQSEFYFINSKLLDYKKQCKALLKRIQNEKALKSQLKKEQLEEKSQIISETKPALKIQLNGPINILTDAYKQMMVNVKPNGKSYMQYKIEEIARFICDNYVDENGKELSILTIKTYLSPNRTDKNPNLEWKIKL